MVQCAYLKLSSLRSFVCALRNFASRISSFSYAKNRQEAQRTAKNIERNAKRTIESSRRAKTQSTHTLARLAPVLLAPTFLLALTLGCASHPYLPGRVVEDRPRREQLIAQLARTWPAQFELTQRVALTVGRQRHDFLGFLVYRNDNTFRAIATGEMGGKAFDFYSDGRESKIIKKPRGMPERPLSEGVMEDIPHLFGWTHETEPFLMERGGVTGLVVPGSCESDKEYVFGPDGRLRQTIESERGRIIREATFSDYRVLPGWDEAIPTRITLKNDRWHYGLEVEVLKIHPVKPGGELMKPRP